MEKKHKRDLKKKEKTEMEKKKENEKKKKSARKVLKRSLKEKLTENIVLSGTHLKMNASQLKKSGISVKGSRTNKLKRLKSIKTNLKSQ